MYRWETVLSVFSFRYRFSCLKRCKRVALYTDAILGLDHIEYERLPDIRVEDIMETDLPLIHVNERFQKALDMVINQNFLCVVDNEGMFMGILTRRVVLKQLKKQIYQLKN